MEAGGTRGQKGPCFLETSCLHLFSSDIKLQIVHLGQRGVWNCSLWGATPGLGMGSVRWAVLVTLTVLSHTQLSLGVLRFCRVRSPARWGPWEAGVGFGHWYSEEHSGELPLWGLGLLGSHCFCQGSAGAAQLEGGGEQGQGEMGMTSGGQLAPFAWVCWILALKPPSPGKPRWLVTPQR